jgi:methylase of polypeptide subunit release factors
MFESNVADNVKKREPKPAFVGGDDGLDYYRIMFDQIIQARGTRIKGQGQLEPSSKSQVPLTCFLEMMTWQVDILRQEFGDRIEFEEVKTFHFNIRIVKAWLK